jgi:O-antigen ligase
MSKNVIAPITKRLLSLMVRLGTAIVGLVLFFFLIQHSIIGIVLIAPIFVLLVGSLILFGSDGVFSINRILLPLFVAAIIFPSIRLSDNMPDPRPEFIVVIIGCIFLLFCHLAMGNKINIKYQSANKWFLLFGLSIILSMAYSNLFRNHPIIGRDFWEIFKLIIYYLIFSLVANLQINSEDMRRYYQFAIFIFLISAVFGFLQYINFADINQILSPYYAPTQMRGLLVHKRITGTTANPNEFGAMMVLASSLALSGGLVVGEKRLRILCWFTLPVFWTALFLTLSRTSLVSGLVSIVVIIMLYIRVKNVTLSLKFKRLLILLLLVCVIFGLFLGLSPKKALSRYSQIFTFEEASSWVARVENWETHFTFWKESPWFGWGPGKETMGTIVDNEWLLILRRYGLIGTIAFIVLFGNLFFGLSKISRQGEDFSVCAIALALQGTFVGYVFYMFLASIYHSLQLMPIFLLFLGLSYSQWRKSNNKIITEDIKV